MSIYEYVCIYVCLDNSDTKTDIMAYNTLIAGYGIYVYVSACMSKYRSL
jgi:hypothetical protein